MTLMVPRVVDLSHYNVVERDGLKRAAAAGIWGVIHKATEGRTIADVPVATRRKLAADAGLLWGTYHFIRAGSIQSQIEHYLSVASPKDGDLMALDWEDNKVSVDQAEEWLQGVRQKAGRKPIVYSGNTAKELLGSRADSFFGSHRLWLAQYSSRPICQRSWRTAWLWQYSGDGNGPSPHNVDGISIPGNKGIDMNVWVTDYEPSRDHLAREWGTDPAPIDQKPSSPQPQVGSRNVKGLQEQMNSGGWASPLLVVDGDYGPRTIAAVMAFQLAHPPLTVDGIAGAMTMQVLEGGPVNAG